MADLLRVVSESTALEIYHTAPLPRIQGQHSQFPPPVVELLRQLLPIKTAEPLNCSLLLGSPKIFSLSMVTVGMCRTLRFTSSTPVTSHWTRPQMRLPNWSEAFSVPDVSSFAGA